MIDFIAEWKALCLQVEQLACEKGVSLLLHRQAVEENERLQEKCRQLEELCRTDHLTGARNPRGFEESAREKIRLFVDGHRQEDVERIITFIMLDLDGFKKVNDSIGYEAGDQLLQELKRSVEASMRAGDLFGRKGGDEFYILIENPHGNGYAVASTIVSIANRFLENAHKQIRLRGEIGISFGAFSCNWKQFSLWALEQLRTEKSEQCPILDLFFKHLQETSESLLKEVKSGGKNSFLILFKDGSGKDKTFGNKPFDSQNS